MNADERGLAEAEREVDALREDLRVLRRAVEEMRKWQVAYFAATPGSRSKSAALDKSKAAEKKVDELLRVTATRTLF